MSNRFITTQKHDQCPDKLYKYIGNIDYFFDAIEKETIYFPLSDAFNDPFDCKIVNDGFILSTDCCEDKRIVLLIMDRILLECSKFVVPFLESGKDYESMEKTFLQKLGDKETIAPSEYLQFVYDYSNYCGSFYDFYDCIKQSYIERQPVVSICRRVACFSEDNSSIPMWAYYANNHTGVCLEYTPSLLKDTEIYNSIQKVNYTDTQNNIPSNGGNIDDLNMMFFNKANCWKHEREWRIVLSDNIERLRFPCLTGIYLGVNFKNVHRGDGNFLRITKAILNSETKISLYDTLPDNCQYKLNFRRIMSAKEEEKL